jgi:hypothetical protein
MRANRGRSGFVAGAAIVLAFVLVSHADATPIILNGGFETTSPPVAANTCASYSSVSTSITDWTVVGPGFVAVCSTGYVQGGVSFVTGDGSNYWLDLTGITSNLLDGVQQTVATTANESYTLSFLVGNVDNTNAGGANFGTTSTVNVFANGTSLGTFTNSCTSCTTTQQWQQFSTTFVADSASTTLKVLNGDPITDNTNGLDNVVLTDNGPASTPVPEPASLVLLGTGLVSMGARRWRKGHGR